MQTLNVHSEGAVVFNFAFFLLVLVTSCLHQDRYHNVMVMTPQLFLNVMDHIDSIRPLPEGNDVFNGIDLLVSDREF